MEMVGDHGRASGRVFCKPTEARSARDGGKGETRNKIRYTSAHKLFTTFIGVLRRHERKRIGAKFRAQTFSALCKIFPKIA
jgi:hypothetical protein